MKKFFLFAMVVAVTISTAAQKIQIKKGEIQLDGVPVAKVDKPKGADAYTFSDLSGTPLFTAKVDDKTPAGNVLDKPVVIMTGTNGNIHEVATDNINISFTFSNESAIVQYVVKSGAGLITPQGVNTDKISDYFAVNDRSVTSAFDAKIAAIREQQAKEDNLAKSVGLTIDLRGNISANGDKIGFIARDIKPATQISLGQCKYIVMDLNRIPVGTMDFQTIGTNNDRNLKITTMDNTQLIIFTHFDITSTLQNDNVAKRMLYSLYYNGYTLGDMRDVIEAKQKVFVDAAKQQSKNIYDQQGSYSDKNGKQTDGLITIEFESLDNVMGKKEGQIADITTYGNMVSIAASKGAKPQVFKASERGSFTVGSRKFVGGTTGGMLGGTTVFFEVLYEKDGNMVLYDQAGKSIYLKLAKQDKVASLRYSSLFGNKKPEKIQKEFDDYVGCPSLTYSDYNTESQNGLIKLVDDYAEKCK